MNLFFSRVRKHLGMLVWDSAFFVVWLFSLRHTFEGISSILVRLSLEGLLVVGFLLGILMRFHSVHRLIAIDDVTGRNNKREFIRVSKKLLKSKASYAIVCADVNQFKLINDMYGNEIGDRILQQIQKTMDQELRWDEVSGRLMADHFCMLVRYHSIDKLDERLARISSQINQMKDADNKTYGLTLTYGVYVVVNHEHKVESMIERANLARGNVVSTHRVVLGVYDEKARKKLNRERELELKMERALEQREFVPYLQPKYELRGNRIAGAEALVRWFDPVEGMVLPGEFIPLFEKNGFIVKLDLYMFEEVCKLVHRWSMAGCSLVPISVNLSRGDFNVPNFFEAYKDLIKKYDVPVGTIEFEFTESLLYNNLDILNDLARQIHELGFSCSIDDFGSGYSSLNMLKNVRVDVLKLDRVFFSGEDEGVRGKEVIRSVLNLAKALELKTVSEGIELKEQVDFLREMKCDYVQGFIFAKPMDIKSFEKLAYLHIVP